MRYWRIVVVGVGLLLTMIGSGRSTPPRDKPTINFSLVPTTALKPSGVTDFQLTVTSQRSVHYDNVSLWAETSGKVRLVGENKWTCSLDSTLPFSAHLQAEFVVNDTGEIHIILRFPLGPGGEVTGVDKRFYFVTTADSVERWGYFPTKPEPWPDWRDQPRGGFPVPGEFPEDDSLWGILKVEPVLIPTQAGPVDLLLSFAPARQPCDSVHFSISGVNGLAVVGDTAWSAALQAGQPYTRVLRVDVPSNDTSWAVILMRCGGAHHTAAPIFVTTGSNLEYYPKNPWGWTPAQKLEVKYRRATNPVGDQRVEVPVTLDSLAKLEQTPYLGEGRQAIWVNGVYYTRIKNEYKFHHWEPYTDWSVQQQKINDSIAAIPMTARYDAKIGVRDSSELAYAKKLIPNLVFAGRIEGYDWYACRTTKAVLYDLSAKNINVSLDLSILEPLVDPDSTPPEKEPAKPIIPDSGGMKPQGIILDPQSTIFSEDFGGSWPGVRTAWDENSTSGYDYWGRSSRTVYGSPYSVWCSGTGGRTDGGAYDSCMLARMQTGPIDLSAYKDITLSYYVWADLPGPGVFDQFWVETSENGVTWNMVYFRNASTPGWQLASHNVSGIQVHLRFTFVSSCGGWIPTHRGVYVDELVISGTLKPNLRPCALPGWAYPLVPANIRGTNQPTTLYAGESTFVDFAEENNGGSTAGYHLMKVYLDDVYQFPAQVSNLDAGDTVYAEDWGLVVPSSGYHDLMLKCDGASSVDE